MPFVKPSETVSRLNLKEGMMIADFGAGSGENTLYAAKQVGNSGCVYAIDIQKDLLSAIEQNSTDAKISTVKTIWGDLEEEGGSKLADGILDVVILSNIMFQAENKPALAKETARVLKGGGKLLLVDWIDSFSNFGPRPEDIVTEEDAKNLMISAGFVLSESFKAGEYHYGLIFTKE